MLALRAIHFIALAGFFGSICTVAITKMVVERSADVRDIAVALSSLLVVDRAITGPSAICLAVSGFAMLFWHESNTLLMPWLITLIGLWIAGLAVAHTVLIPGLKRLADLAIKFPDDRTKYRIAARRWDLTSLAVIVAMAVGILVATYKPFS
jgi:uncharacterized membrane protein